MSLFWVWTIFIAAMCMMPIAYPHGFQETTMANMSYCRWENTSKAMQECIWDLQSADEEEISVKEFFEDLSSDEQNGFARALTLAKLLVEAAGDEELRED